MIGPSVWVLSGTCGEYSDRMTWLVRVFTDNYTAAEYMLQAQARFDEVHASREAADIWEPVSEATALHACEYDGRIAVREVHARTGAVTWRLDYSAMTGGVGYYLTEVPFEVAS